MRSSPPHRKKLYIQILYVTLFAVIRFLKHESAKIFDNGRAGGGSFLTFAGSGGHRRAISTPMQ
jgi:hypothetical protein